MVLNVVLMIIGELGTIPKCLTGYLNVFGVPDTVFSPENIFRVAVVQRSRQNFLMVIAGGL